MVTSKQILHRAKEKHRLWISRLWTLRSEEYSEYDNYDAIGVDTVVDISVSHDGVVGVSIISLCKHCMEQFEIVGVAWDNSWANYLGILQSLNFNKGCYACLLIGKVGY